VKHGGGSVMVWVFLCFADADGVGRLHRVVGTMDSKQYTNILDKSLLGTMNDHYTRRDDVLFQQDHDSKHTSK
ncbi:hypothetical protein BD779DRAFT_1399744, partial [Infundibulicybe gibba]